MSQCLLKNVIIFRMHHIKLKEQLEKTTNMKNWNNRFRFQYKEYQYLVLEKIVLTLAK